MVTGLIFFLKNSVFFVINITINQHQTIFFSSNVNIQESSCCKNHWIPCFHFMHTFHNQTYHGKGLNTPTTPTYVQRPITLYSLNQAAQKTAWEHLYLTLVMYVNFHCNLSDCGRSWLHKHLTMTKPINQPLVDSCKPTLKLCIWTYKPRTEFIWPSWMTFGYRSHLA